MKPQIKKLVEGVNMGLGHEGLKILLKKHGIDVTKLQDGDLVMCINKRGDKLKVIGYSGLVLGYLRMSHGQRIMKDALQFIPRAFGASGFNYDEACKEVLTRRLNTASIPKKSPLDAQRASSHL